MKPDSIQWQYGDLRLREALLLKGDVDAILGFDSTMYFNLVRQGIAPGDIKFLYYADAGLNIYGNAILASKKLLESNPKAVRGFVAATAQGWRDAIANPAAAIAALKKRSALTDEKLETAKLEWLIRTNSSRMNPGRRPRRRATSGWRLRSIVVSKAFSTQP